MCSDYYALLFSVYGGFQCNIKILSDYFPMNDLWIYLYTNMVWSNVMPTTPMVLFREIIIYSIMFYQARGLILPQAVMACRIFMNLNQAQDL